MAYNWDEGLAGNIVLPSGVQYTAFGQRIPAPAPAPTTTVRTGTVAIPGFAPSTLPTTLTIRPPTIAPKSPTPTVTTLAPKPATTTLPVVKLPTPTIKPIVPSTSAPVSAGPSFAMTSSAPALMPVSDGVVTESSDILANISDPKKSPLFLILAGLAALYFVGKKTR